MPLAWQGHPAATHSTAYRASRDAPGLVAKASLALQQACGIELNRAQKAAALKLLCHPGIADIPTGEGKTFVAFVVAACSALTGRSVHVLTANDYLAERDADFLKPAYDQLGLSCSSIVDTTARAARVGRHRCDVLYTTVYQVGFDLLRDRCATAEHELLEPSFDLAVVDEADAVLLDEAVTPLVLTGSIGRSARVMPDAFRLAGKLSARWSRGGLDAANLDAGPDTHVIVSAGDYGASFTESGYAALESLLVAESVITKPSELYRPGVDVWLDQVLKAVVAQKVLQRGADYIVQDNRVVPVQRHTGRPCPQRRFGGGLQQALEQKEGVPLTPLAEPVAETTVQALANRYRTIVGLSGSALPCRGEFHDAYRLPVFRCEPNIPCKRVDAVAKVFGGRSGQGAAMVSAVKEALVAGRAVLVVAEDADHCSDLAALCAAAGISAASLHAASDLSQESEIVSAAGQSGVVTIATVIAGRGTDIQLDDAVRRAGGLRIVVVGLPSSSRAYVQALGRAGRQGDPGDSVTLLSLEDRHFRAWAHDEQVAAIYALGVSPHDELDDPRVRRLFDLTAALASEADEYRRMGLWKFAEIDEIQSWHYETARRAAMAGMPGLASLEDIDEAWRVHVAHLSALKDTAVWSPYTGQLSTVAYRLGAARLFRGWLNGILDKGVPGLPS